MKRQSISLRAELELVQSIQHASKSIKYFCASAHEAVDALKKLETACKLMKITFSMRPTPKGTVNTM